MAVRSVLDIDVNDDRFKKFIELYNKFAGSLAKQPELWAKIGDKQSEMAKGFDLINKAFLKQISLQEDSEDEDKKRLKRLETTEKLWTSISRASATTAKSILDIGSGILKWGGIIGGIATGASLFGIDRLAHSVFDQRRSSLGLGLSIGEQKAFANSFGRFVDPNGFLSGINTAVSDVSKQGALYSIGVNPNQSTSDVAIATLKAVRQLALSTPINQLGILESSRHLSDLGIGVEDLRRLRGTSNEAFNRQLGTYRTGVGALGIDDRVADKWQNFLQQIDKAGGQIFKTFVEGLGRSNILKSFEHLSASITALIERSFKPGGAVEKGINTLAGWIDSLSGALSKPEFLKAVDDFVSDAGALAQAAHSVVHPFSSDTMWSSYFGGKIQDYASNLKFSHFADWTHSVEDKYGLPRNVLAAIKAGESGIGFNPGTGAAGELGVFQMMPSNIAHYGVKNPLDPYEEGMGAAQMVKDLLRAFSDKDSQTQLTAALASYNWKKGQGGVRELMNEFKDQWFLHLPKVVQNYVAQREAYITINNNTGGAVIPIVNQNTQ